MDNYLRVRTTGSRPYDLPVDVSSDGRTFVADQPICAKDINITEVCLFSERIDCPVRFILEAFMLSETEAGFWTITLKENEFGGLRYDLEYYTTEEFGKRVRCRPVFSWDHEKEGMVGD